MIYYHILTHLGSFISSSTISIVAIIELHAVGMNETFFKIDAEIHIVLKACDRGYANNKHYPKV